MMYIYLLEISFKFPSFFNIYLIKCLVYLQLFRLQLHPRHVCRVTRLNALRSSVRHTLRTEEAVPHTEGTGRRMEEVAPRTHRTGVVGTGLITGAGALRVDPMGGTRTEVMRLV